VEFKLDPANENFRKEVRSFLQEKLPQDIAERVRRGFHVQKEDVQTWTKIVNNQGWTAPNWPKEWGGTGWDPLKQFIFEEECALAGAPPLDVANYRMFGPVIMTFGSEDMKSRFHSAILKGELCWGQAFSEPNAGSDLGSLSTRAVRDGDNYVINGSKIWTTNAHEADVFCVLAKTNPEIKRGFSMIVVKADTPGITVKPIIDIGEGHSLNETIFENVIVPASNLIGEQDKGWAYAKFLLDNERASSADVPTNKFNLLKLRKMAQRKRQDGSRLIDEPDFAMRLARLQIDLHALEFLTLRALSEKEGGTQLPVGSLLKIRGSELLQKIGEMQVEALGDDAAYLFEDPAIMQGQSPSWPSASHFAPGTVADFMYRRATTIYGGANEIQRTIIARSYLEV